jgi:large subunit ribosomal protein L14
VVDNSGARIAQIIGHYGQSGQYAYIGDVVKTTIKEAKGEKVRGPHAFISVLV